nr:biotin/lipoyl-binding protein [Dickeya dadantii]
MNIHASKLAGFRRMSQRQRTFLLAGAALLLLAVLVLAYWFHQRFTHIGETDARVMGEVISLASRESGWVTARPVIDGDAIHKDQLLAQIDDRDARLRLAEQEGNLAAADAQISYSQTQRQVTDLTTRPRWMKRGRNWRRATPPLTTLATNSAWRRITSSATISC